MMHCVATVSLWFGTVSPWLAVAAIGKYSWPFGNEVVRAKEEQGDGSVRAWGKPAQRLELCKLDRTEYPV
jgi:hypothetical protein